MFLIILLIMFEIDKKKKYMIRSKYIIVRNTSNSNTCSFPVLWCMDEQTLLKEKKGRAYT